MSRPIPITEPPISVERVQGIYDYIYEPDPDKLDKAPFARALCESHERLRHELAEREAKIARLEASIKQRDREITELRNELNRERIVLP